MVSLILAAFLIAVDNHKLGDISYEFGAELTCQVVIFGILLIVWDLQNSLNEDLMQRACQTICDNHIARNRIDPIKMTYRVSIPDPEA